MLLLSITSQSELRAMSAERALSWPRKVVKSAINEAGLFRTGLNESCGPGKVLILGVGLKVGICCLVQVAPAFRSYLLRGVCATTLLKLQGYCQARLVDPEHEQDKNQEDNERQLIVNDPVSHPLSPPPYSLQLSYGA